MLGRFGFVGCWWGQGCLVLLFLQQCLDMFNLLREKDFKFFLAEGAVRFLPDFEGSALLEEFGVEVALGDLVEEGGEVGFGELVGVWRIGREMRVTVGAVEVEVQLSAAEGSR